MRRIDALFKENAELAILSGQAQDLNASQKIWQAVVPDILKPCTAAGAIKHKRLTVYADNGAIAAKLKLLLPSLLIKLKKQGLEVTAIRVQVQVKSAPQKPAKPARRIPAQAAKKLDALAGELGDSPLGEALARLARHT